MIKQFSKLFLTVLALSLFLMPPSVMAKSNYLYRQHANWIKIKKAKAKDVPVGSLAHPYLGITTEQMEAMLLSIKISKRYLLKKDVGSVEVFNVIEARRYAPFLVEALGKVDADHVVELSVLHKRPHFIIRNDHISQGNIWVDSEGIHFQFKKLYAKMDGDYTTASGLDRALRKARTRRLTLDAGAGQSLSYNSATEIILNPNYDFINQVALNQEQKNLQQQKARLSQKQAKQDKKAKKVKVQKKLPPPTSTTTASTQKTTTERLLELKDLREKNLISQKEYQKLRLKVLSEM